MKLTIIGEINFVRQGLFTKHWKTPGHNEFIFEKP